MPQAAQFFEPQLDDIGYVRHLLCALFFSNAKLSRVNTGMKTAKAIRHP